MNIRFSSFLRSGIFVLGFFIYICGIFPQIINRPQFIQKPRIQLVISLLGIIFIGISFFNLDKYYHQIILPLFREQKKNILRILSGTTLLLLGITLSGYLFWTNTITMMEVLQIIPSPITHLQVRQIQGSWAQIPIAKVTASQDEVSSISVITDSDRNTYWSFPPSRSEEQSTLTIDLGETALLGRISWEGHKDFLDQSPDDYELSISLDGVDWELISVGRAEKIQNTNLKQVTVVPHDVRYIRLIWTTKATKSLYYTLSITELFAYKFDERLSHHIPIMMAEWKSPPGGGWFRHLTQYDLRWSDNPITEEKWGSANYTSGTPPLHMAGSEEKAIFELPKYTEKSVVYFSVRSKTKHGILSRLSNETNINVSSVK